MKTWDEMNYEERDEIIVLFATWLKHYTQEVINKVISQRDIILGNDTVMNMLRELKEREDKEDRDFYQSIKSLLGNYDTYKEYDSHNHVLEHSRSYRDVLYDMYIR